MSDTAIVETAVEAPLVYSVRTDAKPVNETGGKDGLMRSSTGVFAKHTMRIEDGRRRAGEFRLDEAGFELAPHPTRVRDFYDADELRAVYYPEMERLIAERSGARRVFVFDHTLRTSDEDERLARKIREPVKSVHNDYTEWSGPQRVRDFFPDEAESLLARRFAVVQVWRAINTPIERNPLALADSRSLAPEDFIPAERRFPDLLPAHAPRRSHRVQGLRLRQGRPLALERPHLLRRSDHPPRRAAAREHRDQGVRVFLSSCVPAWFETRPGGRSSP